MACLSGIERGERRNYPRPKEEADEQDSLSDCWFRGWGVSDFGHGAQCTEVSTLKGVSDAGFPTRNRPLVAGCSIIGQAAQPLDPTHTRIPAVARVTLLRSP
ncbi:hypothetical protein R1flu_024043 [Riccia fluitans]|uniref:Uncharacterized protein n=1 Tax=Riccia fluitans TaxID=41844 RepID=A0ABD1XTS3_9MARC